MDFKNTKNVWGKKENGAKNVWGGKENGDSKGFPGKCPSTTVITSGHVTDGAFGLKNNNVEESGLGSSSVPRQNAKIYQFEIGSDSSSPSSGNWSGPSSMLSLGVESKKYRGRSLSMFEMHDKGFSSGGSSRKSSIEEKSGQIDWGHLVNSVFKEEKSHFQTN